VCKVGSSFESAAAQASESLEKQSAMGVQIRDLKARNAELELTLAGGAASAAEREAALRDLEAAFRASTERLRSLAKSLIPASDFGKFARRAENIRPALCRMLETHHPSKAILRSWGGTIEDIQRRLALDAAFLALPFATDKGSDLVTQKNLTGVGPVGSGGGSGGLRVPGEERFNPATRDLFLRLSEAKKLPPLGAFKAEIAAKLQEELGKRPPGSGAAARSFEDHLLSKTKALVASVPKEEGAAGAEIKGTFPPALNALFNALLTREAKLACIQERFGKSPLVEGASSEALARVLQAVDSKIESGLSTYPDGSSEQNTINEMADLIIKSNISGLIEAVRAQPNLAKELCALRIQLGVEVIEQLTPAKKELIEAVQQGFEILRPVVLALLEASFSA
jgi:hypothetical protein